MQPDVVEAIGAHAERGEREPQLGPVLKTKPQVTLVIYFPTGQEHVIYLGPHAPHLTPKEIDLLHRIWLDTSYTDGSRFLFTLPMPAETMDPLPEDETPEDETAKEADD